MKRRYQGLSAVALSLLFSACSMLGQGDSPTGASANAKPHANASVAGAVSNSTVSAGKGHSSTGNASMSSTASSASATQAEQLLAEGTELYEKGDFKAAIRKLQGARDTFDDTSTNMQDSLKYLAFSYCVTGQRTLCKAQFVALLKIAPEFVLSRAEGGHPLWGPVFKEARAGVKVATTTSSTTTK